MIKVIVMIDCDICGYPLEQSASSCDPDAYVWGSVASDLEVVALENGWDLHRKGITCPACLLEAEMEATGIQLT
jgi:hypothetical protein